MSMVNETSIKISKDMMGEYTIDRHDLYIETDQAEASSRVLEGSQDCGWDMEYVGYGNVLGIPVRAIYLLNNPNNGIDYDDEDFKEDWIDQVDWDYALKRLVVDVDNISWEQYNSLKKSIGGGK